MALLIQSIVGTSICNNSCGSGANGGSVQLGVLRFDFCISFIINPACNVHYLVLQLELLLYRYLYIYLAYIYLNNFVIHVIDMP